MVDKYNYDRIKDGLGVLFKQIYGQTKEVWLTSHFNELPPTKVGGFCLK